MAEMNPILAAIQQIVGQGGNTPIPGLPGAPLPRSSFTEIPPTPEQLEQLRRANQGVANAPDLSQVMANQQPGGEIPLGLPGNPSGGPPQVPGGPEHFPDSTAGGFSAGDLQISPGGSSGGQPMSFDQLALQELMRGQQAPKEKTWSDTGKELMAPLVVGLLKSLVHPRYGGFLGGLREGIDSGINLWQHQRDVASANQTAAQRNAAARAGVLARMGSAQAQRELTGELRKEGFNVQRESIAARKEATRENIQSREQMHADTVAEQRARDAQISADKRYAQEQENRRTQELIDVRREIAQGGSSKPLKGTWGGPFGVGRPPTGDELANPQSRLYQEDAKRFNDLGLKDQAAAVQDSRLQSLLHQPKSAKNLDTESALIDAHQTLTGLDRLVQPLIPKDNNPEEEKAFLTGQHEKSWWGGGGKPLKYQDIYPDDSPAVQAEKETQNKIARRSYINRVIDYQRYKHGAVDEGKMRRELDNLLSTVGVARQQAVTASMGLTGSKNLRGQIDLYGAHFPDYSDPPSLLLDKSKNLQDSYNRHLFQAGRWGAIPPDQFVNTRDRYFRDQGLSQDMQGVTGGGSTSAASGATTDPYIGVDWDALEKKHPKSQ